MEDKKGITIERVFDAPREMIWRAWTEPEMVKRWWGPQGFTAPSIKIDLRVGGKYVFCMHGPKGSEFDKDLYSAGVYKEIVPMEKLAVTDYFSDAEGNKIDPAVYGMTPDTPAEMDVVVKFEEAEGGKTKLTIKYPRPESEEKFQAMLTSGMVEGWNSSLDKLAESLR
jgi:uncharacterized protein YndB with AHSA1/START domain